MKITGLEVDGFGVWTDLRLDSLTDGLNVFYGPNEAGKSALRAFVRTVLFGFLSGSRSQDMQDLFSYPPVSGGAAAGAITLASSAERSYVIRRTEGPRGGPGMREMVVVTWLVKDMGLDDSVAVVTDGRFSGTNKGCAVAHITPEAADGGPLAVVQDDDIIEIDIPNEKLNINISSQQLKTRMDSWKLPKKRVAKGYLSIYARIAKSADKGAALNYREP